MRMSRECGRGRSCLERAAAVILAAVVAMAPGRAARAQTSYQDPAFEELRQADAAWDRRLGPERRVVDVVCLVPDVATFLEAVGQWDDRHYFPILIDDVECSLRFIRAFRPARVIRYPARADRIAPEALWDRAVEAVGMSWSADDGKAPPRGDAVPGRLGPVPPGVVVSAPGSASLAGAVALAAGRFQPLLRWETAKHFADEPEALEAEELARDLERTIAAVVPNHAKLGDGCDFVTLAGDHPYRYTLKGQRNAFDDLVLRNAGTSTRWAYAGRLMGGPVTSVYRAMCGLFLTPTSALAFNSYEETGPPWSDYAMNGAAARLTRLVSTRQVHGPGAGLSGWHQTFDPTNQHGLLLINTHGGPTSFHLAGGLDGQTADVPASVPVAVSMIHSFSAESPDDAETIAGRWLANGAFAYFGAMNEPYLQSFRSPGLVASFLTENVPLVVAVRKTRQEPFGTPWRLVYFGDPLWRVRRPRPGPVPLRLTTWEPLSEWPAYVAYREPTSAEPEARRLAWVIKSSIHRLQTSVPPFPKEGDVAAVLLGIDRQRLEPGLQTLYDDLLADVLRSSGRWSELIDRLGRIPAAERTRDVRRYLETAWTAALAKAMDARDFRQALALWAGVRDAAGPPDFARVFTERVGRLAETPASLSDWRGHLEAALRAPAAPDRLPALEAELKRVEERLAASKGR